MYSQDKIDIALQVYHQCGYVTNTICMLGYPTRRHSIHGLKTRVFKSHHERHWIIPIQRHIPAPLPSKSKWMQSTIALSLEKYKICVRGDWLQPGRHLCLAEKISPRRHCRTDERQKHKTRNPCGRHAKFPLMLKCSSCLPGWMACRWK